MSPKYSNLSLQNISFVILYRHTLLTIWFDIDVLTILTGNLIPFLMLRIFIPNTERQRTLGHCFSLSQGNEMNRMNVVWCFQLYIYFLDPSISFMIHDSFTLDDIMTIMFLQSPTPEISLQHHLVAYRISYVINFIFNSRKCVLSYLLFIIYSYTFWT